LRNGEKDETRSCKKRELALLSFLRFFDALSLLLRPRAALDYKNQKNIILHLLLLLLLRPLSLFLSCKNTKPETT